MYNSEAYSNNDVVASTTCPDPLWAMGDYPYPYVPVPQDIHLDLMSTQGYPSPAGLCVPDFNAVDDAAFTLAPTETFTNPLTQVDHTYQNAPDVWPMLPEASSFRASPRVSQPVADPYSMGIDPLATYLAVSTPSPGVSPVSTTPPSEDEWVWLSGLLQSPCTTPGSSSGHGNGAGWVAPERHGTNISGVSIYPAEWATAWPTPATSSMALGKRQREAEVFHEDGGPVRVDTHKMPPLKRVRGGKRATGVLTKAKQSTARTRDKPVARIPISRSNDKPKEAGRGAERLATPSLQGIYHPLLLGPSFQQDWVVEPVNGQPTRVEGSVDEKAEHRIDSVVQQRQEEADQLFKIPSIFKPEFRMFLQASEADFARGAVQGIKCRLCPDTKLKNFQEFKRHCKTAEAHPLEIHFCDQCGDYFARPDSLKRHHMHPPGECLKVTPEDAAEKRRVTEKEHEAFIQRLEHGLKTGEDIGPPFFQIMKEIFPGSSKKDRTHGGEKPCQLRGR